MCGKLIAGPIGFWHEIDQYCCHPIITMRCDPNYVVFATPVLPTVSGQLLHTET